jgi:hypothetical protein
MPTRTRWPGDEGYDRMEFARRRGWHSIASWGLNGWDLGSWPYVVVYHRGETELAVDVEGDIDIEEFPTREERDRRTDEIAFFYWNNHGEDWVKGIDFHEQMPPTLRGSFSWNRLKGSHKPNVEDTHISEGARRSAGAGASLPGHCRIP